MKLIGNYTEYILGMEILLLQRNSTWF